MSCALIFAPDSDQSAALHQQGLLPLGETGYWAAPAALKHEAEFFQTIHAFNQKASPLHFPKDWLEGKKTEILSQKRQKIDQNELGEQLDDVFEMFGRSKRLSVVTGPPGAAKTTVTSLWSQIALAKYPAMPVVIMAQEKPALHRLYDRINFQGAYAWTIDQALEREWPREAAIIIDEAGLLCTETLAALLSRAEKMDAVKVILIGDDKQLVSNAPGAPFRWLCIQDVVDRIRLDVSFRQKNAPLRKAVAHIYQGRISEALKYLQCHFLQPDQMIEQVRETLSDAVPDKTFIIVHGPAFITERLNVLCPGFRVLSLAAAQGLAIDRALFILAEPINMGEMLVGCSRQRYQLDLFIDAGLYADKRQLAEGMEPYPEPLMALDIIDYQTLLDIIDQA